MAFFLTKYFWGVVLIFWGLSIIIEKLFKIKIPVIRIILGIILITIGSQLMWNKHKQQENVNNTVNSQFQIADSTSSNIQIFFENKTIDLSKCKPLNNSLQISVMFSSVTILVPDQYNYEFEIKNIMSETALPNSTKAPIGNVKHLVSSSKSKAPVITVYLYSAMSSVDVSRKMIEEPVSDF